MSRSYLSLDDLKRRLQDDDPAITTDDAIYRAVLEGVSRQIDNHTGRRFQPYTATLYFSARTTTRLRVPDLLSITTLKTDNNHDAAYERTWGSEDYHLTPYNAAIDEKPYTGIEITLDGQGGESFPTVPRGVEIAGIWGYWLDTEDTTATLDGSLTALATAVTVSDGNLVDALQTILVDSEQMYVTAKNSDTLTVVRGANGTTAAAHDAGDAVSVYRYPEPVVEATAIQAARIFRRKDAPFGIVGNDALGTSRVIPKLDPDVKMLLGGYKHWTFGAV